MLDRARNTVLAVINKENRGYITPAESDLFFNQGQLEIFEDYFLDYTKWIAKQNARLSNSDYSDIPQQLREKIEIFADTSIMTYDATTGLFKYPTDAYYVNEVYYNQEEADEVDKRRMRYLAKSNLTAPTTDYPIYTRYGRSVLMHPSTINTNVSCDYLRRPKTPKWTYTEYNSQPIFNPSASDFQDLEIHPSDEAKIIVKVLGYVGISIREADVVQLMSAKETIELQKDNQ